MPEERGLYPKMRVRDQLAYMARAARRHRGGGGGGGASAGSERLGIAERAEEPVEALSLGNQQRVQLAVALVHEPDLLILDEPFSGLDPDGVDALSGALRGRDRAPRRAGDLLLPPARPGRAALRLGGDHRRRQDRRQRQGGRSSSGSLAEVFREATAAMSPTRPRSPSSPGASSREGAALARLARLGWRSRSLLVAGYRDRLHRQLRRRRHPASARWRLVGPQAASDRGQGTLRAARLRDRADRRAPRQPGRRPRRDRRRRRRRGPGRRGLAVAEEPDDALVALLQNAARVVAGEAAPARGRALAPGRPRPRSSRRRCGR